MRGHKGFKDCEASHTLELQRCDIDMTITYNVGAYDPGGWEHPPEGCEIDDVRIVVDSVKVHDPDLPEVRLTGNNPNALTPVVQDALCYALREAIDRLAAVLPAAEDGSKPWTPGTPGDVLTQIVDALYTYDPAFKAEVDRAIEWDMAH